MKNLILIIAVITLAVSCTFKKRGNITSKSPVTLASPKNNADSFVLAYLDLKDALLTDTLTYVLEKEKAFAAQLMQLKNDVAINKDSTTNKLNNLQTIFTKFQSAATVETKLKEFQYITMPVSSIADQFSAYKLYKQNCPMAEKFSADSNVYWLSKDKKIKNPFFPHTMPNCGVVVDTINSNTQ